jgi:hypothetical protein
MLKVISAEVRAFRVLVLCVFWREKAKSHNIFDPALLYLEVALAKNLVYFTETNQ